MKGSYLWTALAEGVPCLVNKLPPSRLFPNGPHERQPWRPGSHADNPEDSNYLLLLKPV